MEANDYVPQTTYEVYHNYPEKKVVGLYYVDDDGNKVTPYNLYFSSDMRKCNRNADLCGISARYKENIIKDYYNG